MGHCPIRSNKHLGTPEALTDEQGEYAWYASFTSYGNLAVNYDIPDERRIDQPLRFQGQYCDTETGLHYNRHRYYDPQVGSFITPDPIKLLGGINNYQYVPNPIGWVDPLGLTAQKESAARQLSAVASPQRQTMRPVTPNADSKPDFYVGPGGADSTLPSTAYRYMGYKNPDGSINKYAKSAINDKEARLSYFGFDKLDTGDQVTDAFQVRAPKHVTLSDPDPAWSDGRLRLKFDTLQLYENGKPSVAVPYSHGGKGADLEPFTSAYPEYGKGGAQQLIPDKTINIKADQVDILPEK